MKAVGIITHQKLDAQNESSPISIFCAVARIATDASVTMLERATSDSKKEGIESLVVWLSIIYKLSAYNNESSVDKGASNKAFE